MKPPPCKAHAAALLIAALAWATVVSGEPKDATMPTLHEAKAVSVSILRSPDEVCRYLLTPENFPKWAPNFCHAIHPAGDGTWIADTTLGALKVRFAPDNAFRVADHYVTLSTGEEIQNPIRVLPNGTGSEVVFMVFRRPGFSDEDFRADWSTVQRDLDALKRVLEQ